MKLATYNVENLFTRARALNFDTWQEGKVILDAYAGGDLNDTPNSEALGPLLRETDPRDVAELPRFDDGGRLGTHGNCTQNERLDHMLLPPALFERMRSGGIWRRGVWGGKNGTLWDVYPEMKSPYHAASDHAALWCEIAA